MRPSRPPPAGRPTASQRKVALISLGCSKNLVDSEIMLGALKRAGYGLAAGPEDADVVIVNTCGFITPAREEAEAALAAALRLKRSDPGKTVVAAGCYVERARPLLESKFPGVDAWTGVRHFDKIVAIAEARSVAGRHGTFLYSDRTPRVVSTPGTWAYVKVSEGCAHRCAFCAIPLIKGPYVSRATASIVREARALASLGVKEIDLVSHDTSWYGRDRGIKDGLARLLERLAGVRSLEWIRFLYGYPGEVSRALLEAMAHPKICRYLDIPFQHADAGILRMMGRGGDAGRALRLIERIRTRLPGAVLRTSLIVGFPGEGKRAFRALRRFVEEARFDHLGVFAYSSEDGTAAGRLPDTVSAVEKEERLREIVTVQSGISRARNLSRLGRAVEVLVEGPDPSSPGTWVGRGRFQAPEVDGIIRFSLPAGMAEPPSALVQVEIEAAGDYDLRGRLVR